MNDDLEQFANYIAGLSREAMDNLLLKLYSTISNSKRDRRDAWRRVREATQEEHDARSKVQILDAYLAAYRSGKIVEFSIPVATGQSQRRRKQA